MSLDLTTQGTNRPDFRPRIAVIGVGGGGANAVDNMIAANLSGVEFIVANTDAQQLTRSAAERRIQLGPHITQGNGAGGKPEVGRAGAEEAADEIAKYLDDVHMAFVTAGMGGGTGTGAAPVIARMARERGILTVGVVTKPFSFEGRRRMDAAENGISEMEKHVDTLIVIPNQNLFKLADEKTGWKEAFEMADHVLCMGVRSLTDLMTVPGLVNLDYADIRSVMADMGKAMMGTGEADGEERALCAAEAAIANPLLEESSIKGARGLLINITGGPDLTLFEVDRAANRMREEVDEDANILFGTAIDESLSGRLRISVVAAGLGMSIENETPKLAAVNGGKGAAPPASEATPEPVALHPQPPAPHEQGHTPMAPAPASYGAPHLRPSPAEPEPAPDIPPPPVVTPQHPARPAVEAGSREPLAREPLAQPATPPRRGSLFNRVTQGVRSAMQPSAPYPEPQPPVGHGEPGYPAHSTEDGGWPAPQMQGHHDQGVVQPPRGHARQTREMAPDDFGFDIPAFLRRRRA